MSTTMTIRLGDDMKQRLDTLAKATHRSKSRLAAGAVSNYVAVNKWQISEIQAAVVEANSGDFASDNFASDNEVQGFFSHVKANAS